MNKDEFIKECKKLNIEVTPNILNKLDMYASFLIEYNKHTNLTAITNKNDIYLKHFYDSLTITKIIDLNNINTLLDVGTGAGFPGVVLKIFFPNINITLIDSNNKKITFLNELINKLELTNIKTINMRSEEYAKEKRDYFDLVTSRAVASLPILSELCLPLVKVNSYFIPLKSTIEDELNNSLTIINKLNGKLENKISFNLPKEDALRNILMIKKINITPEGYPRSYDKIKKSLKKSAK